jgi:hypothetical protein
VGKLPITAFFRRFTAGWLLNDVITLNCRQHGVDPV